MLCSGCVLSIVALSDHIRSAERSGSVAASASFVTMRWACVAHASIGDVPFTGHCSSFGHQSGNRRLRAANPRDSAVGNRRPTDMEPDGGSKLKARKRPESSRPCEPVMPSKSPSAMTSLCASSSRTGVRRAVTATQNTMVITLVSSGLEPVHESCIGGGWRSARADLAALRVPAENVNGSLPGFPGG